MFNMFNVNTRSGGYTVLTFLTIPSSVTTIGERMLLFLMMKCFMTVTIQMLVIILRFQEAVDVAKTTPVLMGSP